MAPVKAGQFGTRLTTTQMVAAMLPGWYMIDQPASFDEMATIVAIAFAESSGFCQAVSQVATDGTQGFGVCQIESSHTELGTFDAGNSNHWQNPITNMQMARGVFVKAGGKFDPWSTYGNNRYQMYKTAALSSIQGFLTLHPEGDRMNLAPAVSEILGTVPEVELQQNTFDRILHYLNINTYNANNIHVPNPVSALESLWSAVGKFLGKLTDHRIWASVGYILAGLIVMLVAFARLAHLGSRAARLVPVAGAIA